MLFPSITPGQMADELVAPSSYLLLGGSIPNGASTTYTVPNGKNLVIFSIGHPTANGSSSSTLNISFGSTMMFYSLSNTQHITNRQRMGVMDISPSPWLGAFATNPNNTTLANVGVWTDAPYLFVLTPGTVITFTCNASGWPCKYGLFGALYDA